MAQDGLSSGSSKNGLPDDEISLVDLAAVLYRHRYLIVIGTVLVTVVAVGYTASQPKRYLATTFVEIGQTLMDGSYENIEPPLCQDRSPLLLLDCKKVIEGAEWSAW